MKFITLRPQIDFWLFRYIMHIHESRRQWVQQYERSIQKWEKDLKTRSTTFDSHWKSMENWFGTTTIYPYQLLQCANSFFESLKTVFNGQWTWQPLWSTVRICILTLQPPIEVGIRYPQAGDMLDSSVIWIMHTVTFIAIFMLLIWHKTLLYQFVTLYWFYCQYLYNWNGNEFLQLTSPSPYKYIDNINQRVEHGNSTPLIGYIDLLIFRIYSGQG